MNCTQARFLLYAHLDREISSCEAEQLSRHLSQCGPCNARRRSAQGLARLLRSRMDRTPAPAALLMRLRQGAPPRVQPRLPAFAFAAALLLVILPVVADGPAARPAQPLSAAAPGMVNASLLIVSGQSESRKVLLTGTLVCLQCETRHEAGLCPLPETQHEAGFCADNGEVWRLMSRDPAIAQAGVGQTVTVEGVGFPRSGFLRASRVGY